MTEKATMVFLNEKQKERHELNESMNKISESISNYQKFYQEIQEEEKKQENANIGFNFLMLVTLQPLVFMLLWNWIVVPLAGIVTINFLQSLGLIVMSRIAIGGKK